jgi:alpha-beta hydrolase superfamily lysophospholipase
MKHGARFYSVAALFAVAIGVGPSWIAGTESSAPAPSHVGAPPADLPVEAITIPSGSGSRLSAWFIPGTPRGGAVLLLHGVGANRLQMLERARLFHREGFAVLLFDFQAEGESPGAAITFGYLEAKDARAAFDELRRRAPGERVAVLGESLGGAAAVLADPPLEADAMVLEAVYASFDTAVENRIAMYLGPPGPWLAPVLTPLLTWQVRPRLGFGTGALRPAARVAGLHVPLLIIGGDADLHATLAETKLIYANANAPKELWVIPGARHQDFHHYAKAEYEQRVLDFLKSKLRAS